MATRVVLVRDKPQHIPRRQYRWSLAVCAFKTPIYPGTPISGDGEKYARMDRDSAGECPLWSSRSRTREAYRMPAATLCSRRQIAQQHFIVTHAICKMQQIVFRDVNAECQIFLSATEILRQSSQEQGNGLRCGGARRGRPCRRKRSARDRQAC